jgi:hypothetical protein
MNESLSQIGHNRGPSMEGGVSWRRHCWGTTREALLPVLPVEVIRTRVRRAAALGLDYRTYAGVRAATGRDVVAFLFSTNALRVSVLRPAMAGAKVEKLAAVVAERRGLAVAPMSAQGMAVANPVLSECFAAPYALGRWGEVRAALREALGGLPGDAVVLVGDHALEADWVAAGKLAGFVQGERYFG